MHRIFCDEQASDGGASGGQLRAEIIWADTPQIHAKALWVNAGGDIDVERYRFSSAIVPTGPSTEPRITVVLPSLPGNGRSSRCCGSALEFLGAGFPETSTTTSEFLGSAVA